jgi:hypothetical protein
MTTEEVLINKFGPLLTLSQVAGLLDRSPDGLRLTIRESNPLGRYLLAARIKIGRRVHFRAKFIANLVDGLPVGASQ